MSAGEPVNIRVLDREYTVGCEPNEREDLLAAAGDNPFTLPAP